MREPDAFFAAIVSELPAVVAMGGAERVYVDDALATIRKGALAGGLADFNHDRVSARDKSASQIVALCRTLPVMAKTRLVEVKDANALREADHADLAAYLERPAPETVLVLVFDDVDQRSSLVKLVDKGGALFCKFEHPTERAMPQHVRRRAQRHRLSLDDAAVEALAATVGADLTLLERALEKLALVADAGGAVTQAMVEKHVADTHLEDAFAFVRAVAKGARGPALAALAALQAAREEPLRIVGLLAWQLRQLARVRALLDANYVSSQVGAELSLYGDRLSFAVAEGRRLDMHAQGQRLARLAEADQLLKGSRQAPWLVMNRLVLDLTAPPPSSSAAGGSGARSAGPRASGGARAGDAAPARSRPR